MNLYSSGRHDNVVETIDPDDAPEGARFYSGMRREYFIDHGLTNPANPILAEFRNVYPGGKITTGRMARYLRYVGDPLASSEDDPTWTDGQRDHARKVLTRLLAVSS